MALLPWYLPHGIDIGVVCVGGICTFVLISPLPQIFPIYIWTFIWSAHNRQILILRNHLPRVPADPTPNYCSSSTVENLHGLLALGCSRLLSLFELFSARKNTFSYTVTSSIHSPLLQILDGITVSVGRLPRRQEEGQLNLHQWEDTETSFYTEITLLSMR